MYNLAIRMCKSPSLLAPRLKIFKWKFKTSPEFKPQTRWTRGRHAIIWASAAHTDQHNYKLYILREKSVSKLEFEPQICSFPYYCSINWAAEIHYHSSATNTSFFFSSQDSQIGKVAEHRTSHPTSFLWHGCVYVDPCIHIPYGPSWPVKGIPLLFFFWVD